MRLIFRLEPDGKGTITTESVANEWNSIVSSTHYDPCLTETYADSFRQGLITAKSDIYNSDINPCHIELLAKFQVRANLVVPILQGQHLWGMLIAHHCQAPRQWQTLEIELLKELATQVSIAIRQAELYQQSQKELAERRRTEILLKQANESLEQRVAQRTSDLEIANTQLQEELIERQRSQKLLEEQTYLLNLAQEEMRHTSERISLANAELARAARLKDEFLANMSHELRTPLNSILGMSELLLEELLGNLNSQQRHFIKTIEQSGEHLLALINDILDLAKIESGKMELELRSVSIYMLCESSLNFVRQQARNKQIQINYEIDKNITEIEADERRLLQALVNLLSNAVKFTPEGGSVQMNVNMDLQHQTVEFQIIDNGIGISSENIAKLFQPFVQLDSSLSRLYPGTGLGLSLVRRIVDLHGGSIRVESQIDQGSCFTIILPWHPLEPEIIPQINTQHIDIHQVLVVEDSNAAASQIKHYLAQLGVTSVMHPLGAGALQVALRIKPDVIILDLLLPDCSGWEVLAQLKANSETEHIPVLVISVIDNRAKSLEIGAIEHILKPLSQQKFYQVLNEVFTNIPQPSRQTALLIADLESSRKPVILLTEDNEANIITIMSYLEAHNFQVLLARNGIEAVKMAKEHQPNLILMDIQMPEMDGLEATRLIRADLETIAIPIIALTALIMPGDQQRCLDAGATEYLGKPVKLKHLVSRISELLNQKNN